MGPRLPDSSFSTLAGEATGRHFLWWDICALGWAALCEVLKDVDLSTRMPHSWTALLAAHKATKMFWKMAPAACEIRARVEGVWPLPPSRPIKSYIWWIPMLCNTVAPLALLYPPRAIAFFFGFLLLTTASC